MDLGLSEEVLKAVADAGYTNPTPIQEHAIPQVLAGRDILGCAQTGTGKTASFTLPMIDILASGRARARMPRTLILEPTRELATQVAENFDIYGKYNNLTKALIIGGASMGEQSKKLDKGVDVKVLVIDEADRMLDMGFIPDVEKIVSVLNKIRQTLLFSATMPPEIRRLSKAFLINPKEIAVTPTATSSNNIDQHLVMIPFPMKGDINILQAKKRETLRQLIRHEDVSNALIFCNRKTDVNIVNKSFQKHGFNSATLHGDMSQPARTETMERFKSKIITFLVCSDVAARGLDIDDLSHVFNFDVPTHPEDYVHRIGRTGRAGKTGKAFTISSIKEKKFIDAIKRLTGKEIPIYSTSKLKTKGGNRRVRSTNEDNTKKKGDSLTSQKSGRLDLNNEQEQPHKDKPIIGLGAHVPAFLNRT
jgi:superfamily II DNA/RNA helicase